MKSPLIIMALCIVALQSYAVEESARSQNSGESPSTAAKVFRAGAATSNITPFLGTSIIGGFAPKGSLHIHDELHVRCLVLDDGETRLAFAIVDNVQIPHEFFDAAKQLIHEKTSLPMENMLMAATHSHSAPSLRGTSYTVLEQPFDEYQKFVIRRIADGIQRAINHLEPARIGWGVGEVPQHVFNRRWLLKDGKTVTSPFGDEDLAATNPGRYAKDLLKPAGPVNPKVYFLSVESTAGRPIALLANHWLHYVGGVGKGHISADYFGVFSQRIAQLLAPAGQQPAFVGMLSNGASGDINNNDYASYSKKKRRSYAPYEKMKLVAEDLAQEVLRVRKTIKYQDWVKLGAAQAAITLRYRRPDADQLKRAQAILEKPQPDSRDYTRQALFARRAIDVAKFPETLDIAAQVFRIGDLGIAALPFEVFTEIGLEIENKSPFGETFTIELANGGNGYLPSPKQHELGGYETWLTVNRVEKGASPKIVKKLTELFLQLKNE
ncbi:MAG: hypothetical protein QM496_09810 [Verrucomicrobiota bacterium]